MSYRLRILVIILFIYTHVSIFYWQCDVLTYGSKSSSLQSLKKRWNMEHAVASVISFILSFRAWKQKFKKNYICIQKKVEKESFIFTWYNDEANVLEMLAFHAWRLFHMCRHLRITNNVVVGCRVFCFGRLYFPSSDNTWINLPNVNWTSRNMMQTFAVFGLLARSFKLRLSMVVFVALVGRSTSTGGGEEDETDSWPQVRQYMICLSKKASCVVVVVKLWVSHRLIWIDIVKYLNGFARTNNILFCWNCNFDALENEKKETILLGSFFYLFFIYIKKQHLGN